MTESKLRAGLIASVKIAQKDLVLFGDTNIYSFIFRIVEFRSTFFIGHILTSFLSAHLI